MLKRAYRISEDKMITCPYEENSPQLGISWYDIPSS